MILYQRKRFTVVYEDFDDGISIRTLIKAIVFLLLRFPAVMFASVTSDTN